MSLSIAALIPARAGSKRIPGKNTKLLGGRPLIAWTIRAAVYSGLFDRIIVSSDDPAALSVCRDFPGVRANLRCPEFATDDAPDASWVRQELAENTAWQQFAILRPTSPFRTAETIRRAYAKFSRSECHSLRAVEPAKQHPGKMWWCNGPGYPLTPVCDAKRSDGTPWHSSPTQTLPAAYVQNASLEMAWSWVVRDLGTIAGKKIVPFFTEGYEGFDINTPEDWAEAERLLAEGTVQLPRVDVADHSSPAA